jgi:hypothetical protein
MGLLDDAIREHLQLKLRHGADPAEVARLEHEALAPVPRDRRARAAAAGEPRDEPARPDRSGQPTAEYDVAAAHAAEMATRKPAPNGRESATAARPLADRAVDEDLAGETPDVFHETPEHDRLWFEQKPPSKFDF